MNFCAYGRISIYFCSFGSSSYGHVTSWPMQPQHPLGASPVVQLVMNLPAMRRPGFDSWVRKMPWRRKWQPTPVCLSENSTDRGAQLTTVHGVTRVGHNLLTKPSVNHRCMGSFLGFLPCSIGLYFCFYASSIL